MDHVISKVSQYIGLIFKLQCAFPPQVLFSLYNAIILPHITYCNILWANMCYTKLRKIHRLQKKIVRICTGSQYLAPTKPLFHSLRTLNVFDINKMQIASLMHRYFLNTLPTYLMSMFSLNCHVHDHNTRNVTKFHISVVTTNSMHKSIRHSGPIVWNSIPEVIRNTRSTCTFKKRLKHLLLSQYDTNCS